MRTARSLTVSRRILRTPPPRKNHARPPVNRMTNWCKNITLPQTSFAGGNHIFVTDSPSVKQHKELGYRRKKTYYKYQGVKEFHMLVRIGCFKNYGFQSF